MLSCKILASCPFPLSPRCPHPQASTMSDSLVQYTPYSLGSDCNWLNVECVALLLVVCVLCGWKGRYSKQSTVQILLIYCGTKSYFSRLLATTEQCSSREQHCRRDQYTSADKYPSQYQYIGADHYTTTDYYTTADRYTSTNQFNKFRRISG